MLSFNYKPKWVTTITFLFFGMLFGLAGVYFLERATGESAYTIFCMIDLKSFCPLQTRLIFLLSQWLPLLGLYLGLKLKALLIIYSISHVMYFFLVFLIARYALKDSLAGLALVMIQVVGIGRNFLLYPHIEILLIGGTLVLLYSIMRSKTLNRYLKLGLEFFLLLIIITSYPSAIISIVFIIILHYLESQKPTFLVYGAVLLAFFLQIITQSAYEQTVSSKIFDLSIHALSQIDYWNILHLSLLQKPVLMAFLVATVLGLVLKNEWLLAGLLMLFVLGYIGLFALVMGESVDGHYYPIIPIISITFVYGLFRKLSVKQKTWSFPIIFLALIFSVYKIQQSHFPVTREIENKKRLANYAADIEGDRFIINDENIPFLKGDVDINLHRETMILSALEGPEHAATIDTKQQIINHVTSMFDFLPEKRLLKYFPKDLSLVSDEEFLRYTYIIFQEEYKDEENRMWCEDEFNEQYFKIEGKYRYLNKKETQSAEFIKKNIRIVPTNTLNPSTGCPDGMVCIPVRIINKSDKPLYSHIKNDIFLGYRWQNQTGEMVQGTFKTPIEVDVFSQYEQFVYMNNPGEGFPHLTLGILLNGEFIDVGFSLEDFDPQNFVSKNGL